MHGARLRQVSRKPNIKKTQPQFRNDQQHKRNENGQTNPHRPDTPAAVSRSRIGRSCGRRVCCRYLLVVHVGFVVRLRFACV